MAYQLVDKSAFVIAGKTIKVSLSDPAAIEAIPRFWHGLDQSDPLFSLLKTGRETGGAMLGVCDDNDRESGEFTYWIAVEIDSASAAHGFATMSVPTATWAVFEAVGKLPGAIQTLWRGPVEEFLASGAMERAPGVPCIEWYPEGDVSAPDYHCAVWVPIVRR